MYQSKKINPNPIINQKIYRLSVVLILFFVSNFLKAQSYTEGFETAIPLPSGWASQNLSSPVGSTNWFQGNSSIFSAFNGTGSSYIGANFNNTTGNNTISNWLFTPNRTYNNGDLFSFYTRTVDSPFFPDRLEVRLSTNGNSTNAGVSSTSTGDFTTLLLSVNPTLTTAGFPNTWTQYTITISGLSGPTSGRIAFRYFVTNGGPSGANSDYFGIDNVVYTSNPSPPVVLNCPTNEIQNAGQTQAAINGAFSTWLSTATGSGGCGGVLTNNNTGAPSALGGNTTVTFTYTSTCAPLTTTCQATFTVIQSNYTNLNTNMSFVTLQDAINASNPMTMDTIKLLRNITESNVVANNSVFIKANGYTLTIPSGIFSIPVDKTVVWLEDNMIFNAGAVLQINGTLKNKGTITHTDIFTNNGTYAGIGNFNGTFINSGIVKPGY